MKISDTKFYLGADSGGTKIEFVIVNEIGKIIRKYRFKGIHYSVSGPDKYTKVLSDFICSTINRSDLDLKNCLGICIGLAGAREVSDRKTLQKLFRKKLKFEKILISTDALTALMGAFEGSEGIILICGTGTVLYGYYDKNVTRIGGWGRIIGDEGSGYWIGKKALSIASKEFDTFSKNKKNSSLIIKLNSVFGINKSTLNEMIFKENFQIQKIAPLVLELAEQGSSECLKIVTEAVSDLMYHIETFLKLAKPKSEIGISMIGSLVENDNLLSRKLKKEILKLKKIKIVEKKHSPAYGAYLLLSEDSNLLTKL